MANGPLRVGDRLVGAVVDVGAVDALWRMLRTQLERRRGQGLVVAPHLQEAVDGLRQTAMEHLEAAMSVQGPQERTVADAARPLSTQGLASLLQCSARHARRLAGGAGVRPLHRDLWPADAADRIEESRRR